MTKMKFLFVMATYVFIIYVWVERHLVLVHKKFILNNLHDVFFNYYLNLQINMLHWYNDCE